MTEAHTPGPWMVLPSDCCNWSIDTESSNTFMFVGNPDFYPTAIIVDTEHDAPSIEADARLIAAAPDYDAAARKLDAWASQALPATDEATDYLNDTGWDDLAQIVSEVRAAITKATGAA